MSPQGSTPLRRIRFDDDLWSRFAEAVRDVDPELDRSKVLRQFVRWYIGDAAEPPRRPDPASK